MGEQKSPCAVTVEHLELSGRVCWRISARHGNSPPRTIELTEDEAASVWELLDNPGEAERFSRSVTFMDRS